MFFSGILLICLDLICLDHKLVYTANYPFFNYRRMVKMAKKFLMSSTKRVPHGSILRFDTRFEFLKKVSPKYARIERWITAGN